MEGRPLEDVELVERAQQGDIPAYEELVRRYQDVAYRAAYLITGDSDEAADVIQDAFVKAYRALGRFRSGSPFRPWLLRIVTNEARDRRKARVRRLGLATRLAEIGRPGEAAPSAEATAFAHEQGEAVRRAILELPRDHQLVVVYRYLLDLSEAETAVALGCPRGTVKSRLSRALQRLRRSLGSRYSDASEVNHAVDGRNDGIQRSRA